MRWLYPFFMTNQIELRSASPYPCQFAEAHNEERSFECYFSTLILEQRDPNGTLSSPGIVKNQMFGSYYLVIDVPELTRDIVREHLPELARHIEQEHGSQQGSLEFVLTQTLYNQGA